MLDFMAKRDDGTTNLWLPGTAKGYASQCAEGRRRGALLADEIRENRQPFLLGYVMEAIVATKRHTGVEIGFYQVVAEHLM